MWPGKTEQRSFEVDLLCSHIHEHICGEVCHLKPARQKKAKNSKPKRRNPKQIRMTEILTLKTKKLLYRATQALDYLEF